MMTKPTLYIANALGFHTHARNNMLVDVVKTVRDMGFGVIEPFADNNEVSLAQERSISQELEIARLDTKGIKDADGVLCIISSPIPDEGSMIEVGMALAWGKPVFYLNDDFRYIPRGGQLPMNLMLFYHTSKDTWRQYYYTSLDEMRDPEKGLYKWIAHIDRNIEGILTVD
jgi:nucleoside 2-deoxyribosyltransferase